MTMFRDMQPNVRETWTESNWFERALLLAAVPIFAVCLWALQDWRAAALALFLASWQFDSMRQRVEIHRWHVLYLDNPAAVKRVRR